MTNLIRTNAAKRLPALPRRGSSARQASAPRTASPYPMAQPRKSYVFDFFPDENGNHHDKVWT